MYGFIDESGTAGARTENGDYLIISLTLFTWEEQKKVRSTFMKLRQRLNLKKDYEFHYSRNKKVVRNAVFNEIKNFDFKFYTFAIKKDNVKRHASYANMAEKVVFLLKNAPDIKFVIVIDENPVLLKELNKFKKLYQAKNMNFSEGSSKTNNKLQLVDYVVGSHAKIIRQQKEPNFDLIKSKMAKIEIIEYK